MVAVVLWIGLRSWRLVAFTLLTLVVGLASPRPSRRPRSGTST